MSSATEQFQQHEPQQQLQQLGQQQQTIYSENSLNNTDNNQSIYLLPTLEDYYANLTPFITLAIFVAILLVILDISIFCTTVSRLKRKVNALYRGPSIVLCSLYPIISCAALTTIVWPKSWLFCHTVMHLSFTLGAVMFRQLCFRYVDSEVNYMKETDGVAVAINTPPCCCCCLCLPAMVPSKAKFCLLRYMVWQMPFLQGGIMLVMNVIYYKEQELYQSVLIYFVPFLLCSILIGLWALNIIVRMVNAIQSEYNIMKKMFCVQLVLLLCKFQYMVLDSQLDRLVLGGDYPINHSIYKQTIINLVILIEMILTSMLVQNAYKVPT